MASCGSGGCRGSHWALACTAAPAGPDAPPPAAVPDPSCGSRRGQPRASSTTRSEAAWSTRFPGPNRSGAHRRRRSVLPPSRPRRPRGATVAVPPPFPPWRSLPVPSPPRPSFRGNGASGWTAPSERSDGAALVALASAPGAAFECGQPGACLGGGRRAVGRRPAGARGHPPRAARHGLRRGDAPVDPRARPQRGAEGRLPALGGPRGRHAQAIPAASSATTASSTTGSSPTAAPTRVPPSSAPRGSRGTWANRSSGSATPAWRSAWDGSGSRRATRPMPACGSGAPTPGRRTGRTPSRVSPMRRCGNATTRASSSSPTSWRRMSRAAPRCAATRGSRSRRTTSPSSVMRKPQTGSRRPRRRASCRATPARCRRGATSGSATASVPRPGSRRSTAESPDRESAEGLIAASGGAGAIPADLAANEPLRALVAARQGEDAFRNGRFLEARALDPKRWGEAGSAGRAAGAARRRIPQEDGRTRPRQDAPVAVAGRRGRLRAFAADRDRDARRPRRNSMPARCRRRRLVGSAPTGAGPTPQVETKATVNEGRVAAALRARLRRRRPRWAAGPTAGR